jgi:hypothetical protein
MCIPSRAGVLLERSAANKTARCEHRAERYLEDDIGGTEETTFRKSHGQARGIFSDGCHAEKFKPSTNSYDSEPAIRWFAFRLRA